MSERPPQIRGLRFGQLRTEVYAGRAQMGQAAAMDVAERISTLADQQARVRVVFAAAPSQNEFLAALARAPDLPWDRVDAFHMDEYVGLGIGASQSFARFLRERLFGLVGLGSAEYLDGAAPDSQVECGRYAELLGAAPIDIVCAGIGENGHMAFNDPHVADFCDPEVVKLVAMDEVCRLQQVHDGAFPNLESVPSTALTMTIPALMSCRWLYCVVPGPTKTEAVRRTCLDPVSEACPASIMRTHAQATLYLDRDAAAHL